MDSGERVFQPRKPEGEVPVQPRLARILDILFEKTYGHWDSASKRQANAARAYANNINVYQKYKSLGLFYVVHTTMKRRLMNPQGDFAIKKGEPVLKLHVPPIELGQEGLTLGFTQAVRESCTLLAEYVAQHNLDVHFIYGVTSPQIGRIACRHFGFDGFAVQRRSALQLPDGQPPRKLLTVVYQNTDTFMAHHTPTTSPTTEEPSLIN